MSQPAGVGDVETRNHRGQWVNRVVGGRAESRSFTSREEAIDAGRRRAEELGTRHVVLEHAPTGAITDPDEAQSSADVDVEDLP